MSNYITQQQQFQDHSNYPASFYEQYLTFTHNNINNNTSQEIKDDSCYDDKQSQIYEESFSQMNNQDIQQQTNLQQQIKTSWIQSIYQKVRSKQAKSDQICSSSSELTESENNIFENIDLYYDEEDKFMMSDEQWKNMHYSAIKINQPDQHNIQLENEIYFQQFIMKIESAKMKKNSSKKFVKKMLNVQPIFFNEASTHNKFTIFGGNQLEKYYRDYEHYSDQNLAIQSNTIVDINKIIQNHQDNLVEVFFDSKGKSGLTDFRFIVNHFSKQNGKQYQELAEILKNYQCVTSVQVAHMNKINRQIKFQMISEDEISTAYHQADQYFKNYIKTKYLSDSEKNPNSKKYLMYSQTRSNFNSMDLELHSNTYTKDLLDLLKPDSQMLDFIKSFNQPFQVSQGEKRLQSLMNIVKLYSSLENIQNVPITFLAKDGIEITTTVDYEIIIWPDQPEWMVPLDCFTILLKLNIQDYQIQKLSLPQSIHRKNQNKYSSLSSASIQQQQQQQQLQQQSQNPQQNEQFFNIRFFNKNDILSQNNFELKTENNLSDNKFEFLVHSELFIEKFYPNINNKQNIEYFQNKKEEKEKVSNPPQSNKTKNIKKQKNKKQNNKKIIINKLF
ncbi:hypothetical protein TTHERM_00189570 (macronuclear) [Tetrahymena thermophila SB210]|uniref:Uncharacterized protein n=1 Tax=Tetrahymena thermophila (strain SB210) TaxID=312017 RepID=I7MEH9_TETTS|nr:hypothetical protein TTHERM_00189570 [Tetrahymena thermophila SB210]EAR96388.1 hypothetical protein TTHERM_00189570 [Tetrahymena thermophila SB210]|eukprot:XP_001016633.1 hypothetical protein TTHERM_00189570 [Tetrahymena thermophila SB210]